jgi:Xaa-Pro aminopeptidase
MKALKNAAELAGMRAAHLRDGVVLVRFLAWLTARVGEAGAPSLTEHAAAAELDARRRAAPLSRGLSFDTICGWRGNGAVIHYRPEAASALALEGPGLLLLDSGGQYADGTTDVTRTLWLGGRGAAPPSPEHRRAYTAVLQGHIALSSAVFPSGTGGVALDALARAPIWAQGLEYRHGTGHGVGAHLNVHEGPQGLASAPRSDYSGGLQRSMTITDEPGVYIEGQYGIRIENVLEVVARATACEFEVAGGWCGMAPLTCVPIGTAAVEVAQLAPRERAWLNDYNAWCRAQLAPLLGAEGDQQALAWLVRECAPV